MSVSETHGFIEKTIDNIEILHGTLDGGQAEGPPWTSAEVAKLLEDISDLLNPGTNSSKTIVRELLADLERAGLDPVWTNTGGGCMAIEIKAPWGYMLIAGIDDTFSSNDIDDDQHLGMGFSLSLYDGASGESLAETRGRPFDDSIAVVSTVRHLDWDLAIGNTVALARDVARNADDVDEAFRHLDRHRAKGAQDASSIPSS